MIGPITAAAALESPYRDQHWTDTDRRKETLRCRKPLGTLLLTTTVLNLVRSPQASTGLNIRGPWAQLHRGPPQKRPLPRTPTRPMLLSHRSGACVHRQETPPRLRLGHMYRPGLRRRPTLLRLRKCAATRT